MSEFKGRIAIGVTVSVIVAFGLAVGVLALSPSTTQMGPTSTATNTSTCIFPGQPLGAFISVLASNNSDSFHNTANSAPLSGAAVTAVRNMGTSCGTPTESFTTIMETFTTNGSLWYSLSTLNGGTYQITVSYAGQDYTMTMPLGLSVYNCGILYIPSGISNVTTSGQDSCAQPSTTLTETTSSCTFSAGTTATTVTVGPTPSTSTTTVTTSSSSYTQTVTVTGCTYSLPVQTSTVTSTTTSLMSNTSTTTTSIQCTVSGAGTGLYVTVLSDSGQRIQGAQVTGTVVTEIDSSTCQQDIGTYVTNSTGSVLITQNAGSYYQLSIAYQGTSYPVKAPIAPMETTYVTLMVPSGNVTISEVFEGGCQTSSGGVTCP